MPIPDPILSRRRLLTSAAVGAGGLLLAACGGGSLGGNDSAGGNSSTEGGSKKIRVGLVIPQAGVYTPLGVDMLNGWQLWLDQNAQTMSGYTVETVTADEGEGPDTGVPAIQKLLQNNIDVVVGIVNSATALGALSMFTEAKKLLLITNAGAVAITGKSRTPYAWRASFSNSQNSYAMGEYLAGEGVRKVYIMSPDYAAGQENVTAFTAAFEKTSGAKVIGSALTPFGKTQDFQPFLSGVKAAAPEAVFCFYSGGEAVNFVKQYDQFGLKTATPLYGSGFLTEGSVLQGQGASAMGVRTTLHYSTEIDNPANSDFVLAYQKAYKVLPTCFAMATFDAGEVLKRALAETSGLGGDAMAEALGKLGPIDNSPRGSWQFDGQNPKQKIYLREVRESGGKTVNAVVKDLGVYAQPGL